MTTQLNALNSEIELEKKQLAQMAVQLDLIFLALISLVGINQDAIEQAVTKLTLESLVNDILPRQRWYPFIKEGDLPNSVQTSEFSGTTKDLRDLVLIASYLGQENQALIRRGVNLLEQVMGQHDSTFKATLLDNYLTKFSKIYGQSLGDIQQLTPDQIKDMGLRLLIDLLFLSCNSGDDLLWLTLLNRSR